jgi:hypothetical protein
MGVCGTYDESHMAVGSRRFPAESVDTSTASQIRALRRGLSPLRYAALTLSMDAVYLFQVLDHIPNPVDLLDECLTD